METKQNVKAKKKKNRKKFARIITLFLLIMILILFITLFIINVIPILYTILLLIITLLIFIGIFFCNFSKIKGFRIIGYFFSFLLFIISFLIEIYLGNTLGFLFNVTNGNYILKTYNVVVLNDSDYNDIKDLKNKVVAIYNSDNDGSINKMQKKIKKKVKVNYQNMTSRDDLVNNLLKKYLSNRS